MSCEGCIISSGGTAKALEATRQAAIAYGKEKQIKHIAIWKEGQEFQFGAAATAFTTGKPVSEVLSVDLDNTTEPV